MDVPERLVRWRVGLWCFAGVQIAWSLYSCFGGAMGIWMTFFPPDLVIQAGRAGGANPLYEVMEKEPLLRIWMMTALAVGLLAALGYLASGIALFWCRPWARVVSNACSIASLAIVAIGVGFQVAYFVPVLYPQLQSAKPAVQSGAIGGLASIVGSACCAPLFPIAALVILTRAQMRELCGGPPAKS